MNCCPGDKFQWLHHRKHLPPTCLSTLHESQPCPVGTPAILQEQFVAVLKDGGGFEEYCDFTLLLGPLLLPARLGTWP